MVEDMERSTKPLNFCGRRLKQAVEKHELENKRLTYLPFLHWMVE